MQLSTTQTQPTFPVAHLNAAGLNRQAIFDLAALPGDILHTLEKIAGPLRAYRQLILIGHGGRQLWASVQAAGINSAQPIDDFTIKTIEQCFATELPTTNYRFIYPSEHPIGLQQLGKLAGWHHPSPFMLGIDDEWGSWSAYRAVLLTDTHFAPSEAVDREHPCLNCADQPCISSCPGRALEGGQFALQKCSDYRLLPQSPCQLSCLARLACPIGREHRYSAAQMQHSYGISLHWIRQGQAAK